jgi:glycosyltransferase involved in cell wall biosynthesis
MGHYGEMREEIDGIRIERVPCIPGAATERLTASAISVLKAVMRRPGFDVLHLHTPMTGAFGILPRLLGCRIVLQLHGVDWKRARWGTVAKATIMSLEWVAFRVASVCTAVSLEQCEFYKSRYDREVTFIPTGASLPAISSASDQIQKLGLEPNGYALFLARLVPEKGVHHLIPAFRQLQTGHKLVIAGSGDRAYESRLRELASGDPRILFTGHVEGELKTQLFSHARLFVQSSDLEGLSISLLEAMSYGLCCFSSDLPANREALGDTGAYFPAGNASELSRGLEQLLEDHDLRAAYGRTACQRVMKHYSWDHVTDQIEALYRNLVSVIR